jgi:hypothetical protein
MRVMSRIREIILLVLILGFATTAWAGLAQYTGSLFIHGFANDTTNGASYPFTTNVFLGHPFGITCNPGYGPGTKVCGGTDPTAQVGSPLTGAGTVSVTGTSPAAFTLPQSALAKKLGTPATTWITNAKGAKQPVRCVLTSTPGCGVPGGSFSAYFPYIYSYTYADLKNAAGNFFGGGGPGNFAYQINVGGVVAEMVIKQGANRFGGTMQLLGYFYSHGGYFRNGGLSIGSFQWLFSKVGGMGYYIGTGTAKVATAPGTATDSFTLKHTKLMQTGTSDVIAHYIGWTTGTVTVTAVKRGPFPSVMQRKGYDYRTSKGAGKIQLVSPLLTAWRFPGANTETNAVGFLKLNFTPEPASWMMLFAGASLLGLLYRVQRRSH